MVGVWVRYGAVVEYLEASRPPGRVCGKTTARVDRSVCRHRLGLPAARRRCIRSATPWPAVQWGLMAGATVVIDHVTPTRHLAVVIAKPLCFRPERECRVTCRAGRRDMASAVLGEACDGHHLYSAIVLLTYLSRTEDQREISPSPSLSSRANAIMTAAACACAPVRALTSGHVDLSRAMAKNMTAPWQPGAPVRG